VSVCLSCFSEFITLQVGELLKPLQHDVYRPDADGIKALMESAYMFTSTYNDSTTYNQVIMSNHFKLTGSLSITTISTTTISV